MIAVVRGSSDADAAQRLRTAYDGADADLLATFDDLSAQHLTVYAGMPMPEALLFIKVFHMQRVKSSCVSSCMEALMSRLDCYIPYAISTEKGY